MLRKIVLIVGGLFLFLGGYSVFAFGLLARGEMRSPVIVAIAPLGFVVAVVGIVIFLFGVMPPVSAGGRE